MNEYAFEGPKLQPNFRDMGRVIVSGYDTSYSLPLEVAKRALEKHFSSCGEITDVAFDDRFAYVYFVGEAAVDKALQLFNGSELDGWKLTVEPFPFPNAKDKIIVSVEGFDTCLSQDDLESALTPLSAIAAMYGKNIADKASELNGFYMGERKLAVRLLSLPRISPVHSLPLLKGTTLALLDAHHSASAAAIPQSSESFKTPDKPVEEKRKSSEEEQQTPDRDELFVDDLRMGDPNGKKVCSFRS